MTTQPILTKEQVERQWKHGYSGPTTKVTELLASHEALRAERDHWHKKAGERTAYSQQCWKSD